MKIHLIRGWELMRLPHTCQTTRGRSEKGTKFAHQFELLLLFSPSKIIDPYIFLNSSFHLTLGSLRSDTATTSHSIKVVDNHKHVEGLRGQPNLPEGASHHFIQDNCCSQASPSDCSFSTFYSFFYCFLWLVIKTPQTWILPLAFYFTQINV